MILDLGLIDYSDALECQRELVNKRILGEISDSLLIVEHPAVYTVGRSGSRKNLLEDEEDLSKKGIKVLDVDRGGDITFHGPGQLVAYPIIDLSGGSRGGLNLPYCSGRKKDLHKYLRDLEEVVIVFLNRYGVNGTRVSDATGVWVDAKKIASIGVAAKDWVTYHGLSININTDLKFFSMINPCGMKDIKVTSLKDILRRKVPMNEAGSMLLDGLKRAFGLEESASYSEYHAALA